MSETVASGDMTAVVDEVFDRLAEYFPPPVFVGRKQSIYVSFLAAFFVMYVSMVPALKMKDAASTPVEELTAIGVIIACTVVALLVQKTVAGVVYNVSMFKENTQHFANIHWISEYRKAGRTSAF